MMALGAGTGSWNWELRRRAPPCHRCKAATVVKKGTASKGQRQKEQSLQGRRFHLSLAESSGCHQLPGQSSHFRYPRLVGSRTARKLVENATNFPTCDLKSILAAPLAPLQTNSHQQTLHTLPPSPKHHHHSSQRYTISRFYNTTLPSNRREQSSKWLPLSVSTWAPPTLAWVCSARTGTIFPSPPRPSFAIPAPSRTETDSPQM